VRVLPFDIDATEVGATRDISEEVRMKVSATLRKNKPHKLDAPVYVVSGAYTKNESLCTSTRYCGRLVAADRSKLGLAASDVSQYEGCCIRISMRWPLLPRRSVNKPVLRCFKGRRRSRWEGRGDDPGPLFAWVSLMRPLYLLVVKNQTFCWLPETPGFWSRRLPARSLAPVVTTALYFVPGRRLLLGLSVASVGVS
jgi:hypothetical protein